MQLLPSRKKTGLSMNNLINDYAARTKEKIARQLWCTITADDVEGTLFQVGEDINLLNRVAFDCGVGYG